LTNSSKDTCDERKPLVIVKGYTLRSYRYCNLSNSSLAKVKFLSLKIDARLFFNDTLSYQNILMELLKKKIVDPVLNYDEKNSLPYLTANALLGQGKLPLYLDNNGSILLLGSLHTTLLRMIEYASKPVIKMRNNGKSR